MQRKTLLGVFRNAWMNYFHGIVSVCVIVTVWNKQKHIFVWSSNLESKYSQVTAKDSY